MAFLRASVISRFVPPGDEPSAYLPQVPGPDLAQEQQEDQVEGGQEPIGQDERQARR